MPIVRAIPGSSSWTSNDVAGRPIVDTGLCILEGAAIADCGLCSCAEGGRVLTLLEKELFETFRVDAPDVCRDDTEDEEEGSRDIPLIDIALALALGRRELGGAGAGLPMGSPARSVNVFRLRIFVFWGGGIAVVRALVAEADISNNLLGD